MFKINWVKYANKTDIWFRCLKCSKDKDWRYYPYKFHSNVSDLAIFINDPTHWGPNLSAVQVSCRDVFVSFTFKNVLKLINFFSNIQDPRT